MLKYKNAPLDTMFVVVSETHNPQEPFTKTRGGLFQLMEILTELHCVKFLPVPRDVEKELEEKNPPVICLHVPLTGPIGKKEPDMRYFQGGDNDVRMRRSLRPLLAGLLQPGEF